MNGHDDRWSVCFVLCVCPQEAGPTCLSQQNKLLVCSSNSTRTQRAGVYEILYWTREDRTMCDSSFFRNRVTVPGANIQTVCGVEIWSCLLFVEWLFVGCDNSRKTRLQSYVGHDFCIGINLATRHVIGATFSATTLWQEQLPLHGNVQQGSRHKEYLQRRE